MRRGQVSLEFVTMLSLSLLASSILIGAVSDRAITMERQTRTSAAEIVAQKTAYRIDYLVSTDNSSTKVSYSSSLPQNFTIKVDSGYVGVNTSSGQATFPTAYKGEELIFGTQNTSKLSYKDGELSIE